MDIIQKLNSLFVIKFKEVVLEKSSPVVDLYLLNTFDDKKYLFKCYKKNSSNIQKLKNTNSVVHILNKKLFPISDFIFNKEYDSIVELDDQTVGTLYEFNPGDFFIDAEITQQDLYLLSLLSYTIHKESFDLVQSSFVLKQLPDIYHTVYSDSEKILEYFIDKGTSLMLEGKYKLAADVDIIELKFAHMQKIRSYLEELPAAIININPQISFITKTSEKLEIEDVDQKRVIIDDIELSNIILEDVCIGHPFYEVAKLICNIYLESKSKTISDIKKQIYKAYPKKEMEKSILDMGEQIIDAMISYFLIVELHESLQDKIETERFAKLRNHLIKEKILRYT